MICECDDAFAQGEPRPPRLGNALFTIERTGQLPVDGPCRVGIMAEVDSQQCAVMAGVDLVTVAALMGHASTKMMERYAHLSAEHKLDAVQRLKSRSSAPPTGTTTDTDESAKPVAVRGSAEVFDLGRERNAPGGSRTPDPRLRRPLLYPLSYWRSSRARPGPHSYAKSG